MSGVRVVFLGSGDAFASGGRLQACILVDGPASRLLLDCGATTLVALKRAGIDPVSVDAILLSHFHGDHFGGLPFLLLDGRFAKRERPLVVAGPPEVERRVRSAFDALYAGSPEVPLGFAVEYVELRAAATPVCDAKVVALPVAHTPGVAAHGLRVEIAGRTIAYSGDTAWTESLVALAEGADLFICECYSYETPIPHHLDHRTLLAQRARLRCGRVVLTHLGPEALANIERLAFEVASDGWKLALL